MIHRREQECFSLLCMIFHNLWNSSGITATQIGNIIQTVKLFHTSLFTVSFSSLFFPFFLNHNYSKILKSDWPSDCADFTTYRPVRVMPTSWTARTIAIVHSNAFFFLTASEKLSEVLAF